MAVQITKLSCFNLDLLKIWFFLNTAVEFNVSFSWILATDDLQYRLNILHDCAKWVSCCVNIYINTKHYSSEKKSNKVTFVLMQEKGVLCYRDVVFAWRTLHVTSCRRSEEGVTDARESARGSASAVWKSASADQNRVLSEIHLTVLNRHSRCTLQGWTCLNQFVGSNISSLWLAACLRRERRPLFIPWCGNVHCESSYIRTAWNTLMNETWNSRYLLVIWLPVLKGWCHEQNTICRRVMQLLTDLWEQVHTLLRQVVANWTICCVFCDQSTSSCKQM